MVLVLNWGYTTYMTPPFRPRVFVRNLDARDYLDIFLVASVSSVLLVRFGLHIAGYPSLGGTNYHIAHMLWGGLIMLAAFIINFAFIGQRVQRLTALLGGVGFGVFIDEVGKFVTRDTNYFFRPAVGIIYAVFVVLYLVISYLTRTQKLTSEEYQLNALRELEEAIHNDMSIHERAATRALLAKARQNDPITRLLHDILYALPVAPSTPPHVVTRFRQAAGSYYERLWQARRSRAAVRWFFIIETVAFLLAVAAAIYANLDDVRALFAGSLTYGHSLVFGQLASSCAAAVCALIGVGWLARSRLTALEWFRRSTLIHLLLTEFFLFGRIGFGAMPSFVFNLLLFILLSAALSQERRFFLQQTVPSPHH